MYKESQFNLRHLDRLSDKPEDPLRVVPQKEISAERLKPGRPAVIRKACVLRRRVQLCILTAPVDLLLLLREMPVHRIDQFRLRLCADDPRRVNSIRKTKVSILHSLIV